MVYSTIKANFTSPFLNPEKNKFFLFIGKKIMKTGQMNKHQTFLGPVQETTPVKFSDPLPQEVDVVIIGGGVIGLFAALYMRRSGLSVVVCEKGRIACEQSSRNWGWIRQHGRDRAELPIMMEATRLWEEVDRETGGRTGFKRGGICYLASTKERLEKRAEWLDIAKECQLESRLLTKAEVDKLIDRDKRGGDAHEWVGATHTPNDARAEAWQAIPAIAEMAHDEGVVIIENCAVRALDISGGALKGVVTEHGIIRTSQCVLAAGAWSSLFAKRHGITIPQMSVRSTVCQTEPLPEFYGGNAADENIAFRRRNDGGYNLAGGARSDCYIGRDAFRNFWKYLPVAAAHLPDITFRLSAPKGFPDAWSTKRDWAADKVSPFEETRVLNPAPNMKQVAKLQENFSKIFPSAGKPKIRHAWAGMIDAMPDIVPIVDRVPDMPGLIIATGMSGHGFGIGPGFGKILCEMVLGKTPGHDMQRFRFSRFSDGSKLEVGPDI
jgi:glycine/D-amino acid oxidase-like deaminating enzyme